MEIFDKILAGSFTAALGILGYFIKELYEKVRDIKSDGEVLELVNSKYVSRRELELMIRERQEYREGVKAEQERMWAEIDRLRDFHR